MTNSSFSVKITKNTVIRLFFSVYIDTNHTKGESPSMELKQLEYFLAVNRHRNFTKAAQQLFVTQPTITIAIKKLEKELGTDLFHRDSGLIRLSMAGEMLLPRAEQILKNVQSAIEDLTNLGSQRKKELHLGIPPMSCSIMYPIVLTDYRKEFPDVEIHITDLCNQEIIHMILEEELELAFAVLPEQLNDCLEIVPLTEGMISVLISRKHPLADFESLSIEQLSSESIIMYKHGTSYTEERITDEFLKLCIEPKITYFFENTSTIFDLVEQNYGISFMPSTTSAVYSNLPNVLCKPLKNPLYYKVGLIRNKQKYLSPIGKEFIEFISKIPPYKPS